MFSLLSYELGACSGSTNVYGSILHVVGIYPHTLQCVVFNTGQFF